MKVPTLDQSPLETGEGPRLRRSGALYWLGCALAGIQCAVLPGYAGNGPVLTDGFGNGSAETISTRGFSRLAPSLFGGAPSLPATALAAVPEGKGCRNAPVFHARHGPGIQRSDQQREARLFPQPAPDWEFSGQWPPGSLSPAHEGSNGRRQLRFPIPGKARDSQLSRRDGAGENREEGVRSRLSAPLYFSAALTVSAAAVARLSKERADDAYETYLMSAGRQRQQSHFEEAERYDRIAGAAFAVMEAGVVWSLYLLFF